MAVEKRILNEKGQALMEFVLFLPFLLMMYSVTMSIANSINASINQQKVTRSYFYYRLQNNSSAPVAYRGEAPAPFNRFGQHVNLWGEREIGDVPLAACFKLNIPLGNREEDSCEDSYESSTTQYIRVGTVYGICGATYVREGANLVRLPNISLNGSQISSPAEVIDQRSCITM